MTLTSRGRKVRAAAIVLGFIGCMWLGMNDSIWSAMPWAVK